MNRDTQHNVEHWQEGLAAVAVIGIIVAVASFWLAGMP